MDVDILWKTILADLKTTSTRASFHTLFSSTKLLSFDHQKAIIGCDKPILISIIEKKYTTVIATRLKEYTKETVSVSFIPMEPSPSSVIKKNPNDLPLLTFNDAPSSYPTEQLPFNPEYTFETFAVSSSNQMAYAAATAVAKNPGTSYNPLFLYGGVGVGKTHLMQAIGHQIFANSQHKKIMYCTGEQFTNEIIEAIGGKTTPHFRKKYRRADVLFIDDIQFIAGKNSVQEEFFHTFNTVQQGKGQIILTSDRPPEEIEKLEARLRSRFEGGLIIDIAPPDFELKTAILLIKAKRRSMILPMDVAKLIAANVDNIRKLEGVLTRLSAEALTNNTPITIDLVSKLLKTDLKDQKEAQKTSPQNVINCVLSYYNLKLSQIKSSKRDRSIALPRQIIYYLLKQEARIPLMDIGSLLGGRDHTTILHGVRKIGKLLESDQKIQEDILGIKSKLVG
ncbi:hypothetical protein A3D77_01365 [Candidatus Gottesmanbacteria bacterium RIFCSPHIGHO2_02_FULL_39_11]|uniref:Chromosomal replication initiator protein DnaA n=1 Tax=Candidatus Gottesmanbacteria bacterium RIFCSPHIGHO2_02_FULL_39_11 TaxID=1798382 RepID=A0A1F5ZT68_9BACT|nr:MAG: hypothetical protein A3D77_01365 [Candidatus Gottesmanbacteria bacterium RIFCSPHIGHO2_02_FULL_39_11]